VLVKHTLCLSAYSITVGLSYDSDSVVIDKFNTIEQTVFEHGGYYSKTVGGLKKLLTAMNIPIPTEEVERDYEADIKAEAEEKWTIWLIKLSRLLWPSS